MVEPMLMERRKEHLKQFNVLIAGISVKILGMRLKII